MLEGFKKMFSRSPSEKIPQTTEKEKKGLKKLAERVEMMMNEDRPLKNLPPALLQESAARVPSKDRIVLKGKKKDKPSGPSDRLRNLIGSKARDLGADSETLPGERGPGIDSAEKDPSAPTTYH